MSEGAFWGGSDLGVGENRRWFAESGRAWIENGAGHTTSGIFRMWPRQKTIAYPTMSMDVTFNGWAGGGG